MSHVPPYANANVKEWSWYAERCRGSKEPAGGWGPATLLSLVPENSGTQRCPYSLHSLGYLCQLISNFAYTSSTGFAHLQTRAMTKTFPSLKSVFWLQNWEYKYIMQKFVIKVKYFTMYKDNCSILIPYQCPINVRIYITHSRILQTRIDLHCLWLYTATG